MKNTLKITLSLIIILVMMINTTKATVNKTDSSRFILNGKILRSDKRSDAKCKIELLFQNTVVDSSIINMNKPFKYNLKKNAWYTLRVTKEGHLPLLISFNTELKDNAVVLENTFYFETELIQLADAKNMNQQFIDFPIGLVEFNEMTGRFETTEVFTSNYLAALNKNNSGVTNDLVSSENKGVHH